MIDINSQYEIAIAALLHDIGKLKQRAFEGKEEHLSKNAKVMEGQLLPRAVEGYYTHRHALWTEDFFLSDFIPLLDKNPNLGCLNGERIANAASYHHKPVEGTWSEIIAIADKAAAGNDRVFKGEYEKGQHLKTPLRSILTQVKPDCDSVENKSSFSYRLTPLHDSSAMFPEENVVLNAKDYYALYDEFLNALLVAIPRVKSPKELLYKLVDLMYEYTYCIPSATNDYLNDISLYDHSKVTMSIALALACSETREMPIRACAVGVSGIQSFIFQSKYESFKNAARIFRGRSFIVAFITTAFKEYISKGIGVIPFFDCMDAGGNATFMLPEISGLSEKLRELQYNAEKFLLQKYYGTLSIVMDYSMTIAPSALGAGRFLEFFKSIGKKLSFAKNRKFYYALEKGDYVFDFDLDKDVCPACGKRGSGLNDLCHVCDEQFRIGKNLPVCNYLSIVTSEGIEVLPGVFIAMEKDLGDSHFKYDQTWSFDSSNDLYPVWRINNYVPDVSDFEEIAEKAVSQDGFGKSFLAYLKIDVDSLGSLISTGLPENLYSISRYATLSRSLHFFFNEYVHDLLEMEYPDAYTALSGGDDVFVILPWNQAISLAERLRKDFQRFCNNSELHFSAGIVIAKPKTPFAFMNSKANVALDDEAKAYPGKNAISYLGAVFSLNRLEKLSEDIRTLMGMIQKTDNSEGPISMGMLNRLYLYVNNLLSEDYSIALKYSVPSRLRYDLARNLKAERCSEQEIIKAMSFILNKFDNYESVEELRLFKAMLVHVIYENRKSTGKEDIVWR